MKSKLTSYLAFTLTCGAGLIVWFFVMATTGSHVAATGLTGVIGGVTDARRIRNEQQ